MFIKYISSPINYIGRTHCCIWDMQVFIISQWEIIRLSTIKSGARAATFLLTDMLFILKHFHSGRWNGYTFATQSSEPRL